MNPFQLFLEALLAPMVGGVQQNRGRECCLKCRIEVGISQRAVRPTLRDSQNETGVECSCG
jgi:hypothetical protein